MNDKFGRQGRKIQKKLSIVYMLLLAAGCSKREREARYEQSSSAPMYGSTPGTTTQTQPGQNQPTATTSQPGAISETDRTLVSQVRTELSKDTTLAAIVPSIQITAQNGTVTLSGNVPSEQEKQKIEAAVKSAGNVVTVNNQLQVSSTSITTYG